MREFIIKLLELFDQICILLAILTGTILCILGSFGIFFGSHANFSLPPIAGGLPFLVGWGILRSVQKGLGIPSTCEPKKSNREE